MADSHRRRGARHGDLESCTLCYDTKKRDVLAAEDGDDDVDDEEDEDEHDHDDDDDDDDQ